VIRFENVSFNYPFRPDLAVSDVSLRVRPGELVLVTGASGCGKSTLVRLANGFARQHFQGSVSGRVLIGGRDSAERSVADIARDKAGAMRPGEPVFSAPQAPEVLAVLTAEAAATGADFHGPEALLALPEGLTLAMPGSHQRDNARLALTCWRAMAPALGVAPATSAAAAESAALASVQVPGRFQRIPGSPEFILDGAHNAHGLAALARTLAELDLRPAAVIFSCFKDKDVAAMAPLVASLTTGPVFIPPIAGYDRAADPAALAAALSAAIGPRAVPVADLASALSRATAAGSPVVVCGSLFLLAEFYTTEQAVEKPPSASLLRKVQTLA